MRPVVLSLIITWLVFWGVGVEMGEHTLNRYTHTVLIVLTSSRPRSWSRPGERLGRRGSHIMHENKDIRAELQRSCAEPERFYSSFPSLTDRSFSRSFSSFSNSSLRSASSPNCWFIHCFFPVSLMKTGDPILCSLTLSLDIKYTRLEEPAFISFYHHTQPTLGLSKSSVPDRISPILPDKSPFRS